MIDPTTVPPMGDEQDTHQDSSGCTPPTVVRDGSRAWVDAPLDSPYACGCGASALTGTRQRPLVGRNSQSGHPRAPADIAARRPRRRTRAGVRAAAVSGRPTRRYRVRGLHAQRHRHRRTLRDTPRHRASGAAVARRQDRAARRTGPPILGRLQLPAPQQALADACLVLEGMAAQEDPQPVHLRIAEDTRGLQYGLGQVHIDMGDTEGHVITIRDGRWDIDKTTPVLFRRTKLTGEMPKPNADGNYSQLWKFVPVHEDDRPLVLAWLVQALIQADVPHPVLELLAEHGAIKSTSARCLAQLIDPSPAPLRKAPRDAEGWVTAANASWVVALDNISGEIPLWLSDCLCRAVTGDGDVRRALYTDQDVSVIAFRRAVIINGIDIQVTQGDLADRLLRIALPRINDGRRAEKIIAAEWVKEWPNVLGGLLTLAAAVHHRLPSITVANLPRMADYAEVLAAVDQICGSNGLQRYREQVKRVSADTLDNAFIGALINRRYSCKDKASKEILADLTPTDEKWKPPKYWPDNARAVTGQLTRHAPALRAQGWMIDNDDAANKDSVIRWTILPPTDPEKAGKSSPPSPPNPPEADNGWSDGLWDGGEDGGEDDWEDEDDNPPNPPDPPNDTPLTSQDGLAGMAGMEYTPSQVFCKNCRDEIPEHMPLARTSGYCSKGRCIAANRQRTSR